MHTQVHITRLSLACLLEIIALHSNDSQTYVLSSITNHPSNDVVNHSAKSIEATLMSTHLSIGKLLHFKGSSMNLDTFLFKWPALLSPIPVASIQAKIYKQAWSQTSFALVSYFKLFTYQPKKGKTLYKFKVIF